MTGLRSAAPRLRFGAGAVGQRGARGRVVEVVVPGGLVGRHRGRGGAERVRRRGGLRRLGLIGDRRGRGCVVHRGLVVGGRLGRGGRRAVRDRSRRGLV